MPGRSSPARHETCLNFVRSINAVLHVLERADDRFLVRVERLSLQRFGPRDLAVDPARIEDRLQQARAERPRPRRAFEQIRELRALQTEEPVRLISGKYAAFATPMSALAAMRFSSAWRISGRRSSSDAGKPSGTAGKISASMSRPRAIGPGLRRAAR
jgi:hypothetical protein